MSRTDVSREKWRWLVVGWVMLLSLVLVSGGFDLEVAAQTLDTARAGELEAPLAKGLDEQIDEAFKPIAEWWEGLVFTTIPVGERAVPLVLVVLVAGAALFTIAFKFVNLRLLPLSLLVVSGKYDDLERGGDDLRV